MKKIVNLNENVIRKIVSETIKNILNENNFSIGNEYTQQDNEKYSKYANDLVNYINGNYSYTKKFKGLSYKIASQHDSRPGGVIVYVYADDHFSYHIYFHFGGGTEEQVETYMDMEKPFIEIPYELREILQYTSNGANILAMCDKVSELGNLTVENAIKILDMILNSLGNKAMIQRDRY